MNVITVEKLKIHTRLPILHILSLQGKIEQNQHGICCFAFQLNDEVKADELKSFFKESVIKLYEMNKKQMTEHSLYCGLIDDISIERTGDIFRAIVKTVTSSIKLDREQKMRSFQNGEMTYRDIFEKVIKDYQNAQIIWCLDEDKKIGRPIIQYNETDWEFIIRLASHFNSGIWVDETQEEIKLYIGIAENVSNEKMEDSVYECGISSRYFENDRNRGEKIKENYVYYRLKRDENRCIGDRVNLFGKRLLICSKEMCFENGELLFYYTIGTKEFLYEKTKYNRLFMGLQLEGEVKKVEKEYVKIHLMIDENEEQELFPYLWLPITGNFFYCMPEVGAKVLLQFLGEDERDAVVKIVIRTNADTCNGYSDVQYRIFETLDKKILKFFPDEMSLCGSKRGSLPEVSLKDKAGIYFNIHEKLDVEATKNIVIKAGKIQCNTPVGIIQCGAMSSMEIHQDFNLYSPSGLNSVRVNSENIAMESREEKKKFTSIPNWQVGYASLGAIPAFGSDIGGLTVIEMCAVAGIPLTGGGRPTVALSNAVNGIPYNENGYKDTLQTIKRNVMNGGYPIPKCIQNSKKSTEER